ncbi:alpha/beta fold hydrolase [Actinokineospora inagensis]|uniref:alpha/beta fold hydrolase n=1 Tax=Actinokineospora inagensis TaxID=103730 RepID=UPI0003F6024C|nr:alpha/beta fold hydrolase [Actinokineospora inagensis]
MIPVVVLHGFMETARGHFGHQIAAWGKHRRVLAPDLPGHGRSEVDAQDPYADLLERYLIALLTKFGPADLVAASYLGSPVAARVASTRPDLVRSLVLTGVVLDVPADVFIGWLSSFSALADNRPDVAAAYHRLHGPRWRDTFTAFRTDAIARCDTHYAVTETLLRGLPMPLLIANGSAKSGEREAALRAETWGSPAHGRVIEGGGHIPGQDRPEEFAAAVTDFWEVVHVNA